MVINYSLMIDAIKTSAQYADKVEGIAVFW